MDSHMETMEGVAPFRLQLNVSLLYDTKKRRKKKQNERKMVYCGSVTFEMTNILITTEFKLNRFALFFIQPADSTYKCNFIEHFGATKLETHYRHWILCQFIVF